MTELQNCVWHLCIDGIVAVLPRHCNVGCVQFVYNGVTCVHDGRVEPSQTVSGIIQCKYCVITVT